LLNLRITGTLAEGLERLIFGKSPHGRLLYSLALLHLDLVTEIALFKLVERGPNRSIMEVIPALKNFDYGFE